MKNKVNILGMEYQIFIKSDEEIAKALNCGVGEQSGYCDPYINEISICSYNTLDDIDKDKKINILQNQTLRHEIIHAFMYESGLWADSNNVENWAMNEEMIDWFAIQSPKIFKVFEELDIL